MVHTRARRDHPIKISAMSVPTGNIGECTSKRVLACKDIVPLFLRRLLRISAPCLHRFGHGTVSPSKLVGAWASRCSSSQLRGAAAACSRVHALRCRQY